VTDKPMLDKILKQAVRYVNRPEPEGYRLFGIIVKDDDFENLASDLMKFSDEMKALGGNVNAKP
jgi:hypothetical protein